MSALQVKTRPILAIKSIDFHTFCKVFILTKLFSMKLLLARMNVKKLKRGKKYIISNEESKVYHVVM